MCNRLDLFKLENIEDANDINGKLKLSNSPICLLVEDVLISRKVEAACLSRLGISFQVASNGTEALILFGKHFKTLKLILLDIELNSKLNGFDVCLAIRDFEKSLHVKGELTSCENIKIVALTGHKNMFDRCKVNGMVDCWDKGVLLQEKIRQVLRLDTQ